MNPTFDPDPARAEQETPSLAYIITPVVVTAILADFLLWGSPLGLSAGIFYVSVGVLLLLFRRGRPRSRLALPVAALVACGVQAGIEYSFSNFLAAAVLILLLSGEVFQSQLPGLWPRFSEALFGVVTAPVRWFGFTGAVIRGTSQFVTPTLGFVGLAVKVAWVIAPAAILLVVFACIFSTGNAIFAQFGVRLGRGFAEWLASMDLSINRFVFVSFAATVGLGLFHGTRAPDSARWWTLALPRIPRPDHRLACWQTGGVLVALNSLFCVVNTIDAAYLWRGAGLPDGVSHAEFVHNGVWSLIGAVVFSAVIIAGLFQQQDRVLVGKWLTNLAHLWVLQNLVLIGGVFLRLKLYVDEYQLTEKRVYVGCFLVLVTAGFLFLAWFVEKRRTFNWLLGRNAIATFLLFFVLQFPDVGGIVARYNVTRWLSSYEREKGAPWLDVAYLGTLGPGAWAQLKIVAASEHGHPVSAIAGKTMAEIREQEIAASAKEGWREWQWRHARGRELLKEVR